MGRVVDHLGATGQLDRTIVVFTSDHGDMMGAHGLMEKGHLLHYEEALRVPLLVAHPDGGAGRCDRLVSVVDVAPTLAELAGVGWDDDHDGRPFTSLVGEPGGPAVRDHVTSESVLYGMSADAHGEYVDPATWSSARDAFNASVRTQRMRYTFRSRDEEELFDLETDPYEQHNVARSTDQEKRLATLRRLLASEIRDVFPEVASSLDSGYGSA